jgi:pyruvate kinase
MMKKTKIIATISNHACDIPLLRRLHNAGMDVVRLNTAHQTPDEALEVIENVRAVSDRIAIMVDTKGPEIRTKAGKDLPVKYDDIIYMKGGAECPLPGKCVFVSYDGFVADLASGDQILIDDGDIELTVLDKDDKALKCRVSNDGVIKGRKSINLPSVKIKDLPSLSEKDREFVEFSADQDIDFIAHSFVRRKEDLIAIQEILDRKNSDVKLIAKIENQEGVDNIDEILDHAFGVMVARGDLAIEIPAEKIPIIQKNIVQKCIRQRKPVIIATQMLQSMINSPRPTRAEVSDVANACLDSTDAIMLSGETANGRYPEEAVKMMARIAEEVESSTSTFINTPYEDRDSITGYLAKAAVKASLRLKTRGIIADSISGRTIRRLVAYRGESPISAQCYSRRVVRELALSFGAFAHFMEQDLSSHEFLTVVLNRLMAEGKIEKDSLLTVLAGNFGSDNGASYIEISTAENLLKRK